MKDPFISVVVPCFDEMANLQKGVLDKIVNFLKKKKISFEIIVSDDGSTDGSIEFVKNFIKDNSDVSLLINPHLGKAGAVTIGMLKAKGDYVLFTDMDQATPIEEINKLLPFFSQNYSVVIGSRSDRRKGSPWIRLFMSRVWMIIRNLIIGLGIEDTQCGFKMFSKDASLKIFTKMNKIHNGFSKTIGSRVSAGFDVELLYIAQKMNFKIKEVPVIWLHVETRRVNLIKDSIEGIQYLLQIRLNQARGSYL